MSTFVGRATAPEETNQERPGVDKTRAELVEEAESLGVEVPKSATKAQIRKLIDEAPVI